MFNVVLVFFENVNSTIRSGFPIFRMKEETSEHLQMLFKVFKYVILPASLLYTFSSFFLLRENTLDSMVLGILVFVYSNFLPDLPSAFRNKKGDAKTGSLHWFKKYALLLFAPIFIWLLFSDIGIVWKTTDTFHNFKSLIIFVDFLLLLGL
jgi:hypothetical protein